LAADLVRLRVDVLVTGGTAGVRAAKQATTTIPIVMTASGDAVSSGLIASLARSLKIEIQKFEVRRPSEFESAFTAITKNRMDAVVVQEDALLTANAQVIADSAVKNQLALAGQPTFVEAGGQIGYGVDQRALARRAAYFVDRILKRRQTRRPARRAANQVRAGHQHEDGEDARPHDPTVAAPAGGPGDRVARARAAPCWCASRRSASRIRNGKKGECPCAPYGSEHPYQYGSTTRCGVRSEESLTSDVRRI
jgi:hypothetical protein